MIRSFCSILDAAASRLPRKPLFVFPENRWRGEETVTYGNLALRSAAAGRIIAECAAPGGRALLLLPAGGAFWEAFMGCLARRVIAVPLNIPNLNRSSDLLQQVCRDCVPSVLVTDERTAELLHRRADIHPLLSQLPVMTPDCWRGEGDAFDYLFPEGDGVAFLQYTSGSTANPKGVRVSHENLLANLAMIRDRMEIRASEDSGVTWLPHYHDMGLVGSYLTTLFTENTTVCLTPEDFVLRPARWLELISDSRASICGGPDFAFRLCVERVNDDQAANLDLSSWRVAYIGSESIRSETLAGFTEKFSPRGFRRTAFFPCYGLGEATLMVTGGPPEREPVIRRVSVAGLMAKRIQAAESNDDGTNLVGCGRTSEAARVVILDADSGLPLAEDMIGEVFVSGPAVTRGYYNRDDLNAALFRELSIDGNRDTFLQTGDLGFLSSGELFITGRTKEIIIVRGRNLSPEDIEHRIGDAHDALLPGGAVAFSADRNGEESLIVAAELKRSALKLDDFEEVVVAVRNRIVESFGINPAEILLLRPASIPRTSSGKPKRLVLRDCYLKGTMSGLVDEVAHLDDTGESPSGGNAGGNAS
jgi:acyl-CoA synthetase (AMP-forming)/AMP-acid ligase II